MNTIKKFSFEGQLLAEVEAPVFSNAISLYPDMTITPSMIGLFAQNAFNFDSHKVMLFDINLNLISEKIIDGPSDLYSGQISSHQEDIYVAHVYSGDLDFNNELSLIYAGNGKQPYIAKIGDPSTTGMARQYYSVDELLVYPNPADQTIIVNFEKKPSVQASFSMIDLKGNIVLKKIIHSKTTLIDIHHLLPGIYVLHAMLPDGEIQHAKLIIR